MLKRLKNSVFFWVSCIFLLNGLIFIAISISFYLSDYNYYQDAIPVVGIISELYHENTYVSYSINGKKYQTRLNYYSSSMYEGQKITLYYHRETPEQVRTKDSQMLTYIFMAVGSFALLIGLSLGFFAIHKGRILIKIKESGQLLYLKPVEITHDYSLRRNGIHPYIVIIQYTAADNTIYLLKSEPIWYNPTELLQDKSIPVYLNPNQPKHHYIDIKAVLPDRKVKIY